MIACFLYYHQAFEMKFKSVIKKYLKKYKIFVDR